MAVLKDLIVHGASRFINVVQFDSTKGGIIAADKGVFNKLIATDAEIGTLDVDELNANTLTAQKATVVGLLDVKGELHTNQWTNANISNVGGSFYISPTVSTTIASNGTPMSITITGNANNRTVQVSGGAFVTDAVKIYSGNQTSTASWAIGSHVMFTGTVRLSTSSVDYPLGTCVGYLTAALSSDGFTVGEVSSAALETIISELGTSNLKSYDIKISMFEIGPKATIKPVGIMMTSYGLDKSTYIDIYGGVNAKNTNTTDNIPDGFADPNVRIGYLGGLPAYADSNNVSHQPTGWGIYTDNGYFKGTIVADSGTIGGFSLNANELYYEGNTPGNSNNTFVIYPIGVGSNTNMFINQTTSEGGNAIDIQWALSIGKNFGVDTSGTLYANEANIAGTIIVGGETVATESFVENKIEDLSETLKNNLRDAINDVNENIEVISGNLNDFIGDVNNLISIKDVHTISSNTISETVIGQIDTYSIGAGDNRISFNASNYQEFAYLTNEKLYLNQIELTDRISIANSLTIANFQWINRSGRLTLMKI